MLQLLLTLIAAILIFTFFWRGLGGRDLVSGLLKDVDAGLRDELQEVEDRLDELPEESEEDDEVDRHLRQHYETRRRQLRRQLERRSGQVRTQTNSTRRNR